MYLFFEKKLCGYYAGYTPVRPDIPSSDLTELARPNVGMSATGVNPLIVRATGKCLFGYYISILLI